MALRAKLIVGKIRTTAPKYPSEGDFVASIRAQLNDLEKTLNSILDQMVNVAPDIAYTALQPTFEKSQTWCPYKTGALRNSGYLEITSRGKNPRVEMGYGKGGRPWYTAYVHEMPMYHKPPTRAKWLQAAVLEDLPRIATAIGVDYKAFWGAG